MTGAFYLLLATWASIELIPVTRIFPAFRDLSSLAARSMRLVMRTRMSEWAKERALRLVSRRLFVQSLRSAARLAIVSSPLVAIFALGEVRAAAGDWRVRLALLAVTTAYAVARHRTRRPAGSSPRGERALQRIALTSGAVRDLSFDVERRLYGHAAFAIAAPAPIFIAGLARAGTTILMRALHAGDEFASLSYRDLPFPLAPNGWARIARHLNRHVEKTERGHGDGILHDLDSPEAIEELFWLHHEGERYATPTGLVPAAPSDETIVAFGEYVRLILHRYGRPRYVSKNNNNILRLPALVDAFPDAILVHPYRDPLQQAASLLAQHRRACALAASDPFRARFMTWLGHHEFGAEQRPFLLPGNPRPAADPDTIDYWLRAWIGTYAFLLDRHADVARHQVFVDYDALCDEPGYLSDTLSETLRTRDPIDLTGLRSPVCHAVEGANPVLMASARALHRRLVERSALAGAAVLPRYARAASR